MFSGVTDCYQPLEAAYRITRQCLEVCIEFGNPAAVVTKGFLVVRDADLLARLNEKAAAHVWISIPFADPSVCKLFEPQAPPPDRRIEAIRRLRDAGVPVGVFVAPVIPGLTDHEIPAILEQAAEAGAQFASHTALRLPGSVADVFIQRLRAAMPMRADRVLNRLRDIHGGKLTASRFGHRMRVKGAYWDTIAVLFAISKKRFGFHLSGPPGGGDVGELFGGLSCEALCEGKQRDDGHEGHSCGADRHGVLPCKSVGGCGWCFAEDCISRTGFERGNGCGLLLAAKFIEPPRAANPAPLTYETRAGPPARSGRPPTVLGLARPGCWW